MDIVKYNYFPLKYLAGRRWKVMFSASDAVVVKDLMKIYGGGSIGVNGVSFTIRDGEIYGLIGPNGSGKTTTLKIISTLIKPSRGEVYVYGIDVAREPLKARGMIN
jgi:ABC-2 type transport system ATP-binding protein